MTYGLLIQSYICFLCTPLAPRVQKTADIGRIASKHFVKLTTVSGTKNNSQNSQNTVYHCVTTDKEFIANSKKAKSVFGSGVKDKTGAPKTPPLTMNHVTATEDRRNEANLQNYNDVEEMETNEGK